MTHRGAGADDRSLVDLRSDTVTLPTPAMRRAMAEAEVGDDAYGEDPTVRALEERYAAEVGKPAALYVPSGVMANQLALRVLASPGSVVVAGRRQHVVAHESGAAAVNAGVQFHAVEDDEGTLPADQVRWAVEAAAHHWPVPSLVCVENTHMPASGRPWPLEGLVEVAAAANDLPLHMDGARLFNAQVATGTSAADYAAPVTTVMSCLSKGLCAPVGSVLAGPEDVIGAARVERHRLGGAMRQAGVIAAAGLVALDQMVERLDEDHRRARRLADAVAARWPRAGCDPDRVLTNIVVFRPPDATDIVNQLGAHGVLAGTIAPGTVRLVTHHDVDDDGIERARIAIAAA
jgi:threonine aldolase